MIIWPFTRKTEEKYDLLRPQSRFYHLLNTTGILVILTLIVFTVALLFTQNGEVNFVIVLAIAVALSSPMIVICIHVYYRAYINNIKKAFSKAYYPDKYMKVNDGKDNSIEKAMPIDNDEDADADGDRNETAKKLIEEEKHVNSISERDDRSGSFNYEGGEDKESEADFESTKNKNENNNKEPLISVSSQRPLSPEISDHPIFHRSNQRSVSSMRSDKLLSKQEEFSNGLNDQEKDPDLENDDYSVYEVVTDDKDNEEDKNALIENEARGSQNTYSIISYMILFALLLFAAGI